MRRLACGTTASALLLLTTGALVSPARAQTGTEAEITFAIEEEAEARRQLRRLLSEHDLDPWIFARRVKIEAGVIPHSHPVLTLSTKYLDHDARQLSVFLHEQIHWFAERDENEAAVDRAIEELRQMYPNPPGHEEIGTRSEYSTYLHLIVNWLELDAMRHLIGEEEARTLKANQGPYEWIDDRVLEDTDEIGAVLEEHDLIIDPGPA